MEPKSCSECGGQGIVYFTQFIGYVTHDMAMDAQDMNYEGYSLYQDVTATCPRCEGSGIEPEENK